MATNTGYTIPPGLDGKPILPGDYKLLEPWLDFVRRARQAGATGFISVMTLRLVVDAEGNPTGLWLAPDVKKLEPRNGADELLTELLNSLQK